MGGSQVKYDETREVKMFNTMFNFKMMTSCYAREAEKIQTISEKVAMNETINVCYFLTLLLGNCKWQR